MSARRIVLRLSEAAFVAAAAIAYAALIAGLAGYLDARPVSLLAFGGAAVGASASLVRLAMAYRDVPGWR